MQFMSYRNKEEEAEMLRESTRLIEN